MESAEATCKRRDAVHLATDEGLQAQARDPAARQLQLEVSPPAALVSYETVTRGRD